VTEQKRSLAMSARPSCPNAIKPTIKSVSAAVFQAGGYYSESSRYESKFVGVRI